MGWKSRKVTFSFSDEELVVAAMKVRDAMLNSLPEPEECKREFSAEFEQKMEKLIAREKAMRIMSEVRRWTAAVLILIFIGAGTTLAFDTEARASFVDWVRRVYENSVIYEFFSDPSDEVLPSFELGWIPEGYKIVDVYQNDRIYNAIYQNGDDAKDVFVFEYGYAQRGSLLELYDIPAQHTVIRKTVRNMAVDLYISQSETESNVGIWIDESTGVVFTINCYFDQAVILNIIEEINLVK